MDTSWGAALWRQFGAAIDMLDGTLHACPDALWTRRLWPGPPAPYVLPQFGEFWHVGYHALVGLGLGLAGVPEEAFAPPAPFARGELDSVASAPERPYTREELRAYLAAVRRTCRATLVGLTDDRARRPVEQPWARGQPVSYLELLLHTMRHVQEHAAHLSLFLGQHGIPDAALDW